MVLVAFQVIATWVEVLQVLDCSGVVGRVWFGGCIQLLCVEGAASFEPNQWVDYVIAL